MKARILDLQAHAPTMLQADRSASIPAPLAEPRRKRSRRALLLGWLRKTHLYIGLWGAVLGMLFGATGILMNHRAVLKIPLEKATQKTVQLPLPVTAPRTPAEMATWLQAELGFAGRPAVNARAQPPKTVLWADREVRQPERWTINLQTPQRAVNAEYFVGNRTVRLEQNDATPVGTLMRLHQASGVGVAWVLLSDTIAASLMLLSITGLLLWTQLHAVRTLAVGVSLAALVAAVWSFWAM